MNPSDFDSYVGGFELTASNYSGGAGGSFTNLAGTVSDWIVDGASPVFSNEGSLSGMLFSNDATQSIIGDMPALWEATLLVVAKPANAGNMYSFGGSDTTSNTWAVQHNSNLLQAFNSGSSGFTDPASALTSHVYTVSFSPVNSTSYCQIDLGNIKSTVHSNGNLVALDFPIGAIGRHRTTSFSGWINSVHIFSRALHFRDTISLQNLITSEVSKL